MSPTQPPAIAAPEKTRDPAAVQEGPDPGNAAVRKTAWKVPPPPPPATAPPVGIIGGEESWPALVDSTRAWPKSASSDSLSLSDGSAAARTAQEDLIGPLLQLSMNPISSDPNPAVTLAPSSNAIPATSLQQNGSAILPNLVGHGGGNGSIEAAGIGGNVNNGGHSSSKNSSSDDGISSRGDVNLNNGGIGAGRGCNTSYGDNNIRHNGVGANDNGIRIGTNGNSRGGGSSNFGSRAEGSTSRGEGNSRNGGNHWSNNSRNGNVSNNSFGSRGGRNRQDHERGGRFSTRNYPRFPPVPPQLGMYQPGPFYGPLPPPPPGHFMVQPAFMPHVSPFAYPGPADAQAYPYYMVPVDQQFQNVHPDQQFQNVHPDQHFQNVHPVQQPMHSLRVNHDLQGLEQDIRKQIHHYFSMGNLCHDTYLRLRMDGQGWVSIDLLVQFEKVKRLIEQGADKNFILDAMRTSDIVEVQGNNLRRRVDWARWLIPH